MTDTEGVDGVVVTLREIHTSLQDTTARLTRLDSKVDSALLLRDDVVETERRVRKLEAQNAAHWVVHTIAIGAIAAGIGGIFS